MSTPLHRLKRVTVITEQYLESRLIDAIKKLGASGYTATDVRGQGSRGMRVSEGHNVKIEVLASDSVVEAIVEHLAKHYLEAYAVVVFVDHVEVVRGDKYT